MGLIDKLFKAAGDSKSAATSSQFAESRIPTSIEQTKSRNAPRRDLVKVVLRETMRKHGIPSDWLDCRSLSVLTKNHKSGMHVQFLVRKGDHQLLKWVHALQESFWEQLLRTDPTSKEWLFSVGWEFYGKSEHGFNVLPSASEWKSEGDTQTLESDTLPQEMEAEEDDVQTDLQQLQAMLSAPAELSELPDAAPRKHKPLN